MSPFIEVKNLSKTFFHKKKSFPILKGVNFSIEKGKSLALIGMSGSGKTTLAKILLRLLLNDGGSFYFEGKDVFLFTPKELFAFRKKAQIIFQDPFASLNPRMTIEQILAEPFEIHKIFSKKERKEKITHLIDQVGLSSNVLKRYPHEFSGGEQQRIAIARALALTPSFLILDEALSSIDLSLKEEILLLLKELQKNLSLTYLFITHDLSLAHKFADDIAVLHQGILIEKQASKDFFSSPIHDHSKRLMESFWTINTPKIFF